MIAAPISAHSTVPHKSVAPGPNEDSPGVNRKTVNFPANSRLGKVQAFHA